MRNGTFRIKIELLCHPLKCVTVTLWIELLPRFESLALTIVANACIDWNVFFVADSILLSFSFLQRTRSITIVLFTHKAWIKAFICKKNCYFLTELSMRMSRRKKLQLFNQFNSYIKKMPNVHEFSSKNQSK